MDSTSLLKTRLLSLTTPGLNGNEDYLLNQWLKREPHLTTVEVLANALRSAGEHTQSNDFSILIIPSQATVVCACARNVYA